MTLARDTRPTEACRRRVALVCFKLHAADWGCASRGSRLGRTREYTVPKKSIHKHDCRTAHFRRGLLVQISDLVQIIAGCSAPGKARVSPNITQGGHCRSASAQP